ncbi:ribosome biogenesis GTPase YlqF [Leptotrichia sp. OH3620_COT-345]|uniref:ribosome biogenesis GTPase YlqF n=1 Tax=Leptotrichia sp. OH3620_COT-345 TaxID=2491048 RepID=UPI000F6526A1|nr:ribosome biogenesis GTPase YlqF [Leptotrichia sp. OH3620_COT-345]RRD40655.1 ribosome biogenesis GTPase YlqF [Leptotrichia sp. OH3620_COT-345]
MSINWYPGHMKKTKDIIAQNLKIIDLVIEILDARIPLSSKNPDISILAKNKQKIVVLNKVDLVDTKDLKKWEEYFLENKVSDYFVALSVEKGTNFNELRKITDKVYTDKLEKMKKKGLRKTEVRTMIVGIPNVGKSKFINKFVNKNKARVGNTPGFTRGKQWIKIDDRLELLDTPGILWPKFEDENTAYNLAITGSIKDNILPLEDVMMKFLDKLKKLDKIGNLLEVYNLQEYADRENIKEFENYKIIEILEKRLGISKNEEYNYEIISRRILKDYRSGKIGKFFLELPETI